MDACVQLAACRPNFTIQEYPLGEDRPPKSEIRSTMLRYDGQGSLSVPESSWLLCQSSQCSGGW